MLKRLSILLFLSPLTLLAGSVDVRQETVEGMAVGTVNNNFRRLEKEKLDKKQVEKLIADAPAPYPLYARIIDEKATATEGGTSVVGGPWTRTLNTISTSTITGLTLVTSSITVPAGTYRIQWTSPFYRTDRALAWIADGDTLAVIAQGRSAYSSATTDYAQCWSTGEGVFTVTAATKLVVRYKVATAFATYGLGVSHSVAGMTEIFTTVELWKLR